MSFRRFEKGAYLKKLRKFRIFRLNLAFLNHYFVCLDLVFKTLPVSIVSIFVGEVWLCYLLTVRTWLVGAPALLKGAGPVDIGPWNGGGVSAVKRSTHAVMQTMWPLAAVAEGNK